MLSCARIHLYMTPRHAAPVALTCAVLALGRSAETIQFILCSREQAKLGCRWQPAVVSRIARPSSAGLRRDRTGAPARMLCCPNCFEPVRDREGIPLDLDELS